MSYNIQQLQDEKINDNARYAMPQLNKYQEMNVKIKEALELYAHNPLRDVSFEMIGKRFLCTHCGIQVTSPIVRYFDFEVTKLKCQTCQANNL